MYGRVVGEVVVQFGLSVRNVSQPQKGYRNESYALTLSDGQTVNLLFYKREAGMVERIRQADSFSQLAATAGYPVRDRYDSRTMQLRTSRGVSYAAVYTYLPGTTIPWEAYSRRHIKLLGWVMSDLHALGNNSPVPHEQTVVPCEMAPMVARMTTYFYDAGVMRAMHQTLGVALSPLAPARLERLLAAVGSIKAVTRLHMDLVRGNVLFAPSQSADRWQLKGLAVSGVIDFEKASVGPPIVDMARSLAFLMVDCPFYDEPSIERYFIQSGYMKRGASQFDATTEIDGYTYRQLLHGLVGLFLLYDFYKFLRHTPYESLADNHHYIRTRDILLYRGMLQ